MKTFQTTIDGRRRRVTVPENDDAMLDAIATELSPQAVAVIATRSNRSRQPIICRDLNVERQVHVSWPSIGAVDLATAKRFAADLQAAIEIAERFAERNDRQQLFTSLNRNA